MCWNKLVRHTIRLIEDSDRNGDSPETEDELDGEYPKALLAGMRKMEKLIRSVAGISNCDVRAEIIERQLGYSLRQIEMEMQKGLATGHGLMAILEIHK